jgi:hypothetical protein
MQRYSSNHHGSSYDERVALQASTHDLRNIENLIEKMIKLSETYKGEELSEKLDILQKVYFFLKKDQSEGSQNFFETFSKKYDPSSADRGSYTKKEDWEEAQQREKCIKDIENFARDTESLCRDHRNYLQKLLQKEEIGRGNYSIQSHQDESLESEEPSERD